MHCWEVQRPEQRSEGFHCCMYIQISPHLHEGAGHHSLSRQSGHYVQTFGCAVWLKKEKKKADLFGLFYNITDRVLDLQNEGNFSPSDDLLIGEMSN